MKQFRIVWAILILLALGSGIAVGAPIGPLEGQKAPDFEVRMLDTDETTSLSDYEGSYLMLSFFTTWCQFCTYQMPFIEAFAAKQDTIKVLLVNLAESESLVREYVQKQGLTLPVGLDENYVVGVSYLARYLPTSLLIDPDGLVVKRQVGAVNDYLLNNWLIEVTAND